MSKRVTVCFLGRKVLTKINDGQTTEQILAQINQKNSTAFKHIWLSENGAEGEIDDLDVVDNGESLYLTEAAIPPAEEGKNRSDASPKLGASNNASPSLSTVPSSLGSSSNGIAPPLIPDDGDSSLDLALLHSSLAAISHAQEDASSPESSVAGDSTTENSVGGNNARRARGGSNTASGESSPFTTGSHQISTGNHTGGSNRNSIGNNTNRSIGGRDTPSSIGNSSGSIGRGSPAMRTRSASSAKIGEAINMSDFLNEEGLAMVFEPKGRVLVMGAFSLDFEESIQNYVKNPSKKKLRETFMDKTMLNSPTEDVYIMNPGNATDIAAGHNTVVSVTEDGHCFVAGAYLLVPACIGQQKPRTAPSPPFLQPEMLSIDMNDREVWYVASGAFHSACITREGEVVTWGYNINCLVTGSKAPEIEQSIRDRRYPFLLPFSHLPSFLSSSFFSSSFFSSSFFSFFSLRKMRYMISGQLGHALRGQKSAYFAPPQTVEGLHKYGDICQVACGGAHTAALTSEGQLLTWGSNDEGQLGWTPLQVKQYIMSTPTPVVQLNKIRIAHVACGSHHTIVCDSKGKVYTWGYNHKGQLGVATPEVTCSIPQNVVAIKDHFVEMVAAGASHSVVLTNAGIVLTWGSNEFGELGRTKHKDRPEQPTKMSEYIVTHISAGPNSTAAVTDEGLAFVWGKLAGEKMGGHESQPRLIQSLFDKKYFICKAGCGLTDFTFLLDDNLTSLVESFMIYCDDKIVSSHDEITKVALDLAPALLRRVQARAYRNIVEKKKEAPLIKVSSTQLFFGLTMEHNFVTIQDLTVTNTTENKMTIKGSLELSRYKSHLSFEPKQFDNVKPGQAVTFRVALAASIKLSYKDMFCIVAEPVKGLLSSSKQGGLRYFVVYNFDQSDENSFKSGVTPSSPATRTNLARAATMHRLKSSPTNSPVAAKTAFLPRAISDKAPAKQQQGGSGRFSTVRSNGFGATDFSTADLEIFERLGSGGSLATVYRCTVNGFTCAMKELGEAPPEVQASFLNEITLLESLSHDNIVRYLGHYVTPSQQIRLFMEYYPMSLADLIKKRKVMPASECRTIARDVARGLEYLHAQTPPVIHRDIKPGNCLIALDPLERVKVVKITDFDISKALFEGAAAMTCAGTTIYMAPEVFSGKPYSIEADVWSFGMMMVEILTQKHPYHQHRNFDVPKLICDGVLPELTPEIIADESYKSLTDIIYECFKDVKSRPSAKELVVKLLAL